MVAAVNVNQGNASPGDSVDMKVVNIPMSEIYSDSSFNIRGEIRTSDVVDLARNINEHGLAQPIAVQPYHNASHPDKKYRIVLGHRRHAAFKYLQRETIPAIIRTNLSEMEALALNFNENINRKDLNILEEAYGVKRFSDAGKTNKEIAKMINKGSNWVAIRLNLLKMPDPIKEDAAAGFLTQAQILDLSEIRNPDEQLDVVKRIKESKFRGETKLPKIREKKKNVTSLKKRNTEEVYELIEHIIEETGQASIVTRTLAWTNGEISDLELHRDLIEFYKSQDVPYQPPIEVQEMLRLVPSSN